jgi:hypothetical protein
MSKILFLNYFIESFKTTMRSKVVGTQINCLASFFKNFTEMKFLSVKVIITSNIPMLVGNFYDMNTMNFYQHVSYCKYWHHIYLLIYTPTHSFYHNFMHISMTSR